MDQIADSNLLHEYEAVKHDGNAIPFRMPPRCHARNNINQLEDLAREHSPIFIFSRNV